ncbi:hypothetical protein [Rhizobium sp.]|jgi:hypothetical protein|uniref:hypothetical protein n=1 Tax=Rhizobium sp. TaxID=391 RepID=UPI000E90B87D|nr:hypothetical protein [Rhizobium sp.]
MQSSTRQNLRRWLAFGPAAFALAGSIAAHAAPSSSGDIHGRISAAETALIKAISTHDTALLRRTVGSLGPMIEDALKRKKAGGQVSSCDMAAHSLGFAGKSLSDAIALRGKERKLLMDDARQAAADFDRDMSACDAQAGQKTGNHAGVAQALRAL